jgi:hypothetical protein
MQGPGFFAQRLVSCPDPPSGHRLPPDACLRFVRAADVSPGRQISASTPRRALGPGSLGWRQQSGDCGVGGSPREGMTPTIRTARNVNSVDVTPLPPRAAMRRHRRTLSASLDRAARRDAETQRFEGEVLGACGWFQAKARRRQGWCPMSPRLRASAGDPPRAHSMWRSLPCDGMEGRFRLPWVEPPAETRRRRGSRVRPWVHAGGFKPRRAGAEVDASCLRVPVPREPRAMGGP